MNAVALAQCEMTRTHTVGHDNASRYAPPRIDTMRGFAVTIALAVLSLAASTPLKGRI